MNRFTEIKTTAHTHLYTSYIIYTMLGENFERCMLHRGLDTGKDKQYVVKNIQNLYFKSFSWKSSAKELYKMVNNVVNIVREDKMGRGKKGVCVCVCVRARACVCVCMCGI